MRKLSPDRVKFLQEYLMNGNNAVQACLAIHPELTYAQARNKAKNIMKHPLAKDYLEKQNMIMAQETRITREFMEEELMDLLGECKEDRDRQNRVKTLDIMNKVAGLYNHKKEVDVKADGIVINFISPEDDD